MTWLTDNTRNTKTMLNVVKTILSIVLTVIFYLLIVLTIYKLSSVTYDFMYQVFGEVSVQEAPGTDVEFTISEGESTMSVAKRLEYAKLVVNQYSFLIRTKLDTSGGGIMPGTYELNTSMSYGEILSVITKYSEGIHEVSE